MRPPRSVCGGNTAEGETNARAGRASECNDMEQRIGKAEKGHVVEEHSFRKDHCCGRT